MIKNKAYGLIVLVISIVLNGVALAEPDIIDVKFTGGQFTVWKDGVQQGTYNNQLYKALQKATNIKLGCLVCDVKVSSPDITAHVTRTPIGNETECGVEVEDSSVWNEVNVSWDIPTERENGTPLDVSEIKSYLITFKKEGEPFSVVNVLGGATTSYTVKGLTAGNWMFQLTTFTFDGANSKPTEPVYKLIAR